jgi:hypothetical protein
VSLRDGSEELVEAAELRDRGGFVEFMRDDGLDWIPVLRLRSSDVVRVEIAEGTGHVFIAP